MALIVSVLDASIANVALPSIAHDLKTTPADSIAVVSSFQLGALSLNKLVEEWATVALAQLDAENHYRLRATRGRPEVGLALLDKLDRTLGRRSARKKATG
jgi:hypothetical protein